jgi:putative NADPH-quinone reductase
VSRRLLIIDGHPDADPERFVHALAEACATGAAAARHEIRRISVAELNLPLLRSRREWEAEPPPAVRELQDDIAWAEHLIILYPLWMGDMPAMLKGFFEQVLRPGFAIAESAKPRRHGLLHGRSAQIVVTMGMPAFFYRFFYGAHSVKALERNILKLAGIGPVTHMLIGSVEGSAEMRAGWREEMFALGEAGRVPLMQ